MKRLCWALAMVGVLVLLMGACTTNSGPTTEPGSTITEKEAIAIASDLLPPEAVARAKVVSILRQELGPHGMWQVEFLSANVTPEELGWQEDAKTKFVGSDEVLMNVIISMDARTGEILSRTAGVTFLLGGLPPESSTQQVELNSVRLLVPGDWHSQVSPEKEQAQRILVSAKDPAVHGDVRIYTDEIQRPPVGPWIELAVVAQYVVPENSPSAQTVPGSGVEIIMFRDVEIGPFTTDQYYVPSKNVMITTRYWTTEEGNLVSQIISGLSIIE